jgi:hypothetical protein
VYDDEGRIVEIVVEREPRFDEEQYRMFAALDAYEGGLNEYGIPRHEAMSIEGNPDNPDGLYHYEAKPILDFSVQAVEREAKLEKWNGKNYSAARKWRVTRVEGPDRRGPRN